MAKDPRFVPRNIEKERKETPVQGNQIFNNSITKEHIQNGAITTEKIADSAIVANKIQLTSTSLNNAATTTIFDASSYISIEIIGILTINVNAPSVSTRFLIKSQVTKKGNNTDYLLSYQTSGDNPPIGFTINATSGGLVQITLPSINNFSSSSVQFSFNRYG